MDSVLVAGGETLLGREIALFLAERGFAVYALVSGRSYDGELEHVARQRGIGRVRALAPDTEGFAGIEEAVHRVHEEAGPLFGIVNSVGTGLRGFFEDLSEEEIRGLFETNVLGTMAVTRAALPFMRPSRRGRVVIITSVAGRIGSLAGSAYAATKFALEGFAESLYQELLPFGIYVVLVEPGVTRSLFWDVHRMAAKRALQPESPYFEFFQRAETAAGRLADSTSIRTVDIARTVFHALVARRPRLRYVVGTRAALVCRIRRYAPDALFERIYFGQIIHHVMGSKGTLRHGMVTSHRT